MKLKKQKGNVMDVMSTGICILAMCALVLFYLQIMGMITQKQEVNQVTRKYILRMETVGYLTVDDAAFLNSELSNIGISEVNLEGTTMNRVGYGEPISLRVRGKLKGGVTFEERKVSTAKN